MDTMINSTQMFHMVGPVRLAKHLSRQEKTKLVLSYAISYRDAISGSLLPVSSVDSQNFLIPPYYALLACDAMDEIDFEITNDSLAYDFKRLKESYDMWLNNEFVEPCPTKEAAEEECIFADFEFDAADEVLSQYPEIEEYIH